MCCRLSASDVPLLWASVHGSLAHTNAEQRYFWILIFMLVSPRSIISVPHPLSRKSVTTDRIVENEILDKV